MRDIQEKYWKKAINTRESGKCGRIVSIRLIAELATRERIVMLINIYALNKDDPDSMQKVIGITTDFTCDNVIFCGDFNLAQDTTKDKQGVIPQLTTNL